MKIYVSNLGSHIENDELKKIFSAYGTVYSAKIVTDRETNKSRNFAFVEMKNESEAEKAIKELNGFYFGGRCIVVNQAKAQQETEKPARSQFANFWK